ncbi:MAG: helix-turn-helix domain-containing protein [Proteobacteria bacterium]|nr:helix-turn-helix domain-containing protein [Pseudomonadota bacterium]
MKLPSGSGGIKSAERCLAILEFFQERKRAATVGEIAASLGLPQSSTSMLLKCLVSLGYLEYTAGSRSLRPTYRVALLGNWIQKSFFKYGPLTDAMEAIQREIGETVVLGRQNGPAMQYVHIVDASYAVRLIINNGTLRPMTRSALGMILLAQKPDHEARAIIRRNNADATADDHRVNERIFLAELEDIRRQGFAESKGRMISSASTIAMLVPADRKATPLGIGVGGPIERISRRRREIIAVTRRHLETLSSRAIDMAATE